MTVLSNNKFDVFFSSPWCVKWRKSRYTHAHPAISSIHPSRQREKIELQPKNERGGSGRERKVCSSPPPRSFSSTIFHLVFDSRPSFFTSETARKRLLRCLRAATGSPLPLFGLTLYVFLDQLSRCGSTDSPIYCMPGFFFLNYFYHYLLLFLSLSVCRAEKIFFKWTWPIT